MNEYNFTLTFSLPDPTVDPETYLDALYEAGCDDALIGVGIHGTVGLDFVREADSSRAAISSAIRDVKSAIPDAELIEISPDYVSVAEIANVLDCTRQNVRKLIGDPTFPVAVHLGGHQSIWRMTDVLAWAIKSGRKLVLTVDLNSLRETTRTAAEINTEVQMSRYCLSATRQTVVANDNAKGNKQDPAERRTAANA